MPKKQTPEEKEKAFQVWKEQDDYKAIQHFMEIRMKDEQVKGCEIGYKDIWHDWQPVLTALWDMATAMKVPRKSKSNSPIVLTDVYVCACRLRVENCEDDVLGARRSD